MSAIAVVTGSGGLIGSESVRHFARAGYDVVGIENDLRARLFGPEASTARATEALVDEFPREFRHAELDIRDTEAIDRLFARHGSAIEVVVHAAAQPSHDWAASDPPSDFAINAVGTLVMLEAARAHAPDAAFVFTSTNKVYGDLANRLPLVEHETRLDLPPEHRYFEGIDTTMSIDRSLHSLFGVSKTSADLLVQEYGRYFDMPTISLRCGCLTGPSHAGTRLHGFLSYLMRCTITGRRYEVYGYGGKQVRDNIHSADLVSAFEAFVRRPRAAAVYNLGGGRAASCSVLEGIDLCQRLSGRELDWVLRDEARVGDHRWWISDHAEFRRDYPEWAPRHDLESILTEIHDENLAHWSAER